MIVFGEYTAGLTVIHSKPDSAPLRTSCVAVAVDLGSGLTPGGYHMFVRGIKPLNISKFLGKHSLAITILCHLLILHFILDFVHLQGTHLTTPW